MNPKDPDETIIFAPTVLQGSPNRLQKKINQARATEKLSIQPLRTPQPLRAPRMFSNIFLVKEQKVVYES
jgi:hypothetical protein